VALRAVRLKQYADVVAGSIDRRGPEGVGTEKVVNIRSPGRESDLFDSWLDRRALSVRHVFWEQEPTADEQRGGDAAPHQPQERKLKTRHGVSPSSPNSPSNGLTTTTVFRLPVDESASVPAVPFAEAHRLRHLSCFRAQELHLSHPGPFWSKQM